MNSEPLTPEERALAQRLTRLGPHGEPSPALDSRILAAAHAATTAMPARKAKPPWPVALGIAASLALAVGIAWQLRPLPEAAIYDEAASATGVQVESSENAAESAATEMATQPRAELPSDDFGKPPPAEDEARRERKVTARGVSPAGSVSAAAAAKVAPEAFPQAAAPPPPPEEPMVLDEPMPVAAPAVSPAAAATTSRALAAPAAARETHETDTQADAVMDIFEADEEVVPPATADSPEVRDAWLDRIRELAQAGKTDEARASLGEFRHRYPEYPVPDDLRALAE